MHLVTVNEARQVVSEGWLCWTRNCSLRTGCVHICSETPSAASQSAGPRHQHHQCIGCPCRRTGVDPHWSWWHTFSAFTLGLFDTGIVVPALKQTGTVCWWREALNRSVNRSVNALAQCLNHQCGGENVVRTSCLPAAWIAFSPRALAHWREVGVAQRGRAGGPI